MPDTVVASHSLFMYICICFTGISCLSPFGCKSVAHCCWSSEGSERDAFPLLATLKLQLVVTLEPHYISESTSQSSKGKIALSHPIPGRATAHLGVALARHVGRMRHDTAGALLSRGQEFHGSPLVLRQLHTVLPDQAELKCQLKQDVSQTELCLAWIASPFRSLICPKSF